MVGTTKDQTSLIVLAIISDKEDSIHSKRTLWKSTTGSLWDQPDGRADAERYHPVLRLRSREAEGIVEVMWWAHVTFIIEPIHVTFIIEPMWLSTLSPCESHDVTFIIEPMWLSSLSPFDFHHYSLQVHCLNTLFSKLQINQVWSLRQYFMEESQTIFQCKKTE